jgi:hypothetical protein
MGLLIFCRNPTFGRVWGWHSHSRNGDLGVLWDSQNFRVGLQGSKHFTLKCSLYHWKAMKVQMSKMNSHGPFGHMQHKLCVKEGSGVKLTIWLPTTKSRESTRPQCVHGEWNTPLESSQGELQVCFRPCPNQRSEQRVMTSWSPGNPNRDSFETPPWESRDKKPFECGCSGATQIILYGGRWWLPSSLGRGELSESMLLVACLNTNSVSEVVLTNLLVDFWCRIK